MEIVFARDGIPGYSKQPTICKKEGNTLTPILFFAKSKLATKVEFLAVSEFLIKQAEKTIKK